MPLFSIIIPTYNRVDLIHRALNSVWSQTFTDYEVIVIDDGSTDGTWEELCKLKDKIITLQQNNKGPGAARNLGAQHASGEYLAFLDSDDAWFPWTLSFYAQAILENSMPALVAGEESFEEENEEPVAYENRAYQCLFDACVGVMPPIGGTPAVAIRRDVFSKHGGFVSKKVNAEDTDLWLRVGEEQGFVHLIEPPVFRQCERHVSVSQNMQAQEEGILLLLNHFKENAYSDGRLNRKKCLKIITAKARSVSFDCLEVNDFPRASRLYFSSFYFQVRQLRLKYLLGFPIFFMIKKLI